MSIFNNIHYFDVVFLAASVLLIVLGISRGLIGELFRLLSVVGGVAAGLMFYRQLFPYLKFLSISPSAKVVVGFIAIFLVAMILILVLGWLLQKVIRLTMLGWVDRLGGGAFGFLKAIVLAWVFVRSTESSPFTTAQIKLRSARSYQLLAKLPPKVIVPYFDKSGQSVGRLLRNDPVKRVKEELDFVRAKVDSAKASLDKATSTETAPAARKEGAKKKKTNIE